MKVGSSLSQEPTSSAPPNSAILRLFRSEEIEVVRKALVWHLLDSIEMTQEFSKTARTHLGDFVSESIVSCFLTRAETLMVQNQSTSPSNLAF